MTWRVWVVAAVIVAGASGPADASSADPPKPHVNAGQTQFTVAAASALPGSRGGDADGVADADPIVSVSKDSFCALGGAQTCSELAQCDNGEVLVYTTYTTVSGAVIRGGSNCPVDADPPAAQPTVTPGLVLAAFRRLPLPPSQLNVQPPDGRTLVNFDTNFFTDDGELTRVVRLLGQRVELRIWAARFGWRFGDGVTRWTTSAGSAYPDLEITHRYLRAGRVAPSVDTTYAARFRVNGGPWREVAGTVTIPGAAVQLRVVTARPVLVGN